MKHPLFAIYCLPFFCNPTTLNSDSKNTQDKIFFRFLNVIFQILRQFKYAKRKKIFSSRYLKHTQFLLYVKLIIMFLVPSVGHLFPSYLYLSKNHDLDI